MDKIRKVVLIGPVYPYKGGISHYTGLLARALRERFKTLVVSWKMQYPSFLISREQRDYSNDSFRVEDARFLINTANPFNIVRSALLINRFKADLVIIQWWHPYFAPCYSILKRFLKAPVLFICHNVFPHERFPMDRALTRMALSGGDYFILHSEKEAQELKKILRNPRFAVNMHPTYGAFDFGRESGASHPEEEGKRLLFFGFVRPYKGLDILYKTMSMLRNEGIELMVAGDFDGKAGEYREMAERLGIDELVTVHDGYVGDDQVERYFKAADAVVLPYLSATQSGIAQIAFGFEKPVIATRVGGLEEAVKDGETGILCGEGDPMELKAAIERFYSLNGSVDFAANIRADSERFSWSHLVDTIEELVR